MKKTLVNLKVKIQPDFGSDAVQGVIILVKKSQDESIIVKLLSSFCFEGVDYEYIIVSPRYEGSSFNKLLDGGSLLCAILRLPAEQINSVDPFDISWWRGGAAFIGTVISN